MSTLTYAALTTKRDESEPGTSTKTSRPGVSTYVDAFAALVPAEVLTLHALIIAVTTVSGSNGTKIDPDSVLLLMGSFYGLLAISMLLYAIPRIVAKQWDKLDWLRILIPPLAFAGWTMLQRVTAFDAAFPSLQSSARTVIALFLGVVLGLAATALAYQADQKNVSVHESKKPAATHS